MKLTAKDVSDLAVAMSTLSFAVTQYRWRQTPNLKPAEIEHLQSEEESLDEWAEKLNTLAMKIILADLQTTGENIVAATKKATKAVQTLKDVAKVIDVAAAAILLGAAVAAGNPQGVAAGVAGVLGAAAPQES